MDRQDLSEMLVPFRELRFGVLATSDDRGPYASLIAFAFTPDGRTIIFATPKATRKYGNIESHPEVSILIDNRSQTPEDLASAEAVTLTGRARPVQAGPLRDEYSRLFAAKHPQLADFINAPDTVLIEVKVKEAVHVRKFQQVTVWSEP